MQSFVRTALASAVMALASCPVWAITASTFDTFQDGTTQGWGSGAANPAPPTNMATGGPAGAGDRFLMITANGLTGPGSRLVGINDAQWSGDYLAAGVTAISMDLKNLGTTDLTMRLAFVSGSSSVTTSAVTLPAGGAWTQATFQVNPSALTGDALGILANVLDLRLFYGTAASFPGGAIFGSVGVDNIRAVPEPTPAALLLGGLAAMTWLRRRRRG